jgi:hypothetical protein
MDMEATVQAPTIGALQAASCLSQWYPKIANKVPTPRTIIVRAGGYLGALLDGREPTGYRDFIKRLRKAVEAMRLPVFLRTGQTSAKFDWNNTCHLTNIDDLEKHVYNIVEFSEVVDLRGLDSNVWAVRELLGTEPAFEAFGGRLPITTERRYFVRDGKVVCRHPYWPAEALAEGFPEARCPDWRERLERLNAERPGEVNHLTFDSTKVAMAVPGFWSVDWLWTKRGWYLTDMARGEISWHWPGCENA